MTAVTVQGMGNPVTAEVAADDMSRARGLAGHAPLGQDEGLWFPYDAPRDVGFWMSSLSFPIDMVFCRSRRRGQYEVRKVARNCRPGDLDEITSYDVDGVLEVAANRASTVGVGDVIQVGGVEMEMAALYDAGQEPDVSEETQEKIDLHRPANDPLVLGLEGVHHQGRNAAKRRFSAVHDLVHHQRRAQDDQAAMRHFLVAFDTSETWSQVRSVLAQAASQRAQNGPEADPEDRVRALYEIRIAIAGATGQVTLDADATVRERLGRIARKHLDNTPFQLEFSNPDGRAKDGSDLPQRTWTASFRASFEGIRDIDATGVVVSVRLM